MYTLNIILVSMLYGDPTVTEPYKKVSVLKLFNKNNKIESFVEYEKRRISKYGTIASVLGVIFSVFFALQDIFI